MIQENLMEILKTEIPGLTWTIDYRTANDNTGTVYSTGGSGSLGSTNMPYRYPTYQVYIRSSDWDYAKTCAEITFQTLHNKRDFIAIVPYMKGNEVLFTEEYYVFLVSAMSDPIRVGDNGGIMEYSVNFDVILSPKGEPAPEPEPEPVPEPEPAKEYANILMVTESLSSSAVSETKDYLVSLGNTVTAIDANTFINDYDYSEFDIIAPIRYQPDNHPTLNTKLEEAQTNGKPLLIGFSLSQTQSFPIYYGLAEKSIYGWITDTVNPIIDNSEHYIIRSYEKGSTQDFKVGSDYIMHYEANYNYIGLSLVFDEFDSKYVVAVEPGTTTLNNKVTNTRIVFNGFLYKNYTQNVDNLIQDSIRWLLGNDL